MNVKIEIGLEHNILDPTGTKRSLVHLSKEASIEK